MLIEIKALFEGKPSSYVNSEDVAAIVFRSGIRDFSSRENSSGWVVQLRNVVDTPPLGNPVIWDEEELIKFVAICNKR